MQAKLVRRCRRRRWRRSRRCRRRAFTKYPSARCLAKDIAAIKIEAEAFLETRLATAAKAKLDANLSATRCARSRTLPLSLTCSLQLRVAALCAALFCFLSIILSLFAPALSPALSLSLPCPLPSLCAFHFHPKTLKVRRTHSLTHAPCPALTPCAAAADSLWRTHCTTSCLCVCVRVGFRFCFYN